MLYVSMGADPNVMDENNDTALHYACENPDDEDVEDLVEVLMKRYMHCKLVLHFLLLHV